MVKRPAIHMELLFAMSTRAVTQHPGDAHRRQGSKASSCIAGFTLIELIMTIAIAAILMAVAVPSFQDMIRTNRVATVANEMVRALQLTRSEAVTRGQRTSLCSTSDPNATTPSCSENNWANGWISFVDLNGDGMIDKKDIIIRVGAPTNTSAKISSNRYKKKITYQPTGRTMSGNFQITVGTEQRKVKINITGRIRVCKPSEADC